jgi:hypothetical protein
MNWAHFGYANQNNRMAISITLTLYRYHRQPNCMRVWLCWYNSVLAVVMIKRKKAGYSFFRGINLEVSMPTGSLCAERNAIGQALAADPCIPTLLIH